MPAVYSSSGNVVSPGPEFGLTMMVKFCEGLASMAVNKGSHLVGSGYIYRGKSIDVSFEVVMGDFDSAFTDDKDKSDTMLFPVFRKNGILILVILNRPKYKLED